MTATLLQSAGFLNHTSDVNDEINDSHPYTVKAWNKNIQDYTNLYSFTSMQDAKTALTYLLKHTDSELEIIENITASKKLGHW